MRVIAVDNFQWPGMMRPARPGEVLEPADELGGEWIRLGLARRMDEPGEEQAIRAPAEKAIQEPEEKPARKPRDNAARSKR
jgi:hypothetical protein